MTTSKLESTDGFDLHPFEEFVNEISARRGFEATVLKCNGDTGEWTAGKKNTPMNGKKLVADITDLMKGWLSFKDGKPIYAVVRVEDRISLPRREGLGDTDERLWGEKQEDPWKKVMVVPFFDLETRETFIFSTTTEGGTGAVGSLVNAFTVEQHERPKTVPTLPVVELDNDDYVNKKNGKRIFTPVLDIIGWTDRPVGVKRSLPPPMPNFITVKSEASPNVKVEHNNERNEPPPYSDDELNQLMRESKERAENYDVSFGPR
jgi:hypothetical protein